MLNNIYNKTDTKKLLLKKLNNVNGIQAEQESQIIITYAANRENYYDVKDNEINNEMINKILNERIKGKPLAKIINEKGFWKSIFYTDDYTLDPRADSEIIVENVLKDCEKIKDDKINFLDLCCGTGCLGISIINELKNSHCDFIDISKKAINACLKNINKFKKKHNTKIFHSDLFENYPLMRLKKIDFIICNPPYIPTGEYFKLNQDTLYDPRISLDGGKSGINYYVKIINYLLKFKFKGFIYFEIDPIIRENMYKYLLEKGIKIVYKKVDYLSLDRLIKIKLPV